MRALARRLPRAIPLYVALLLALAAIGAFNQRQLDRELALMEAREAMRADVVALRAEAAAVEGPLAVSRWAQDRGMVPAPEIPDIEHVMPLAPPVLADAQTGLEVRTVWR